MVESAAMGEESESLFAQKPSSSSLIPQGIKKRGQGIRSWIRVEAATGCSQIIELDKFTMMRQCDLPARDLRLLDPLFVYPSTVLGREKAIVVNLEPVRCVITAEEVFILNSLDNYVIQYVVELQRRLPVPRDNSFEAESPDSLPFEFRALEVALETACSFLDAQASELEIEAYPLLDDLTAKINTLNLESVRKLKSRLVALTRRVQKVRDEVEQLMDDDGDMAEMYLTEKKKIMEASFYSEQSSTSLDSARQNSFMSIEELEMLLEAYFVVIDSTLNKLTSLKEYIDDTEDFINIQLDNVRNQLIQFELLLTTATFVVAIIGVAAGIFGMNFTIPLFNRPSAFKWVIMISVIFGTIIFSSFLLFFKYKRLMS